MAFKLKNINVSSTGKKASPFKINDSLVMGASDSAKKFVDVETAYAAGAGQGNMGSGVGGNPFEKKDKTTEGSDPCAKLTKDLDAYAKCVEEQSLKNKKDPPPVIKVEGDSDTKEIVEAG